MYIHEAIKEALKAPSTITRPGFSEGCFLLVAPNKRDCLYLGTDGIAAPIYGWEPAAKDLMADDWTVTRVDGAEWSLPAQSQEKRLWRRLSEKLSVHK